MEIFKQSALALSLLALGACVDTPPSAYQTRTPESLLVSTSDLVTIDLTGKNYLKQLSDTLEENPPSRALLNCTPDAKACKKAMQLLTRHQVIVQSTGAGNNVTLMYDHIAARDCEQRYVDNSQNERNLNYESLGCSVYGNAVQMVTDKRQFTNPNLLDYRDGEKTASAYDDYLNPPAAASGSGSSSGAVSSLIPASSSGGGQ